MRTSTTQGDASLRPTVAYEMALGPILPLERGKGKPLTGRYGVNVTPNVHGAGEDGSIQPGPWESRAGDVDTGRVDWAPRLCFVIQIDGETRCVESLNFEADSDALKTFTPKIWVAGDPDDTVTLQWEVWDPGSGWRSKGDSKNVSPLTPGIDPAIPPAPADLAAFAIPFDPEGGPVDDPPEFSFKNRGQAALYARRQYNRPGDGTVITVRSQPLLISIYEASP